MSAPAIEIRAVAGERDLGLFHEAAVVAQGGNPLWRPPLRYELGRLLGPGSPIVTENDVRAFVALYDGRPVGRVAAIVNRAHLARHADATGHFGFLEAIDDEAVFGAILKAACSFLGGHGLRRIAGPFSLTINHETGLLVHGFDQPHLVRTNYAPPYYARHLESLGFRKAMDLLAYSCRTRDSDYPERVRRLIERSPKSAAIVTRGLSYRTWTAGSAEVNRIYNDAWSANWNAVPVSDAEAGLIAELSLPVIKPSWIRIAEQAGEPVALVGHLPDVNQFAPARGELFPFGWARLLGGLHGRGPRRSRIAMIGIVSRFRGTPTGRRAISILMAEAIERARRARIEEVEISWMLETNRPVLNLVEALPARHTRTFRVYEREIAHVPSAATIASQRATTS